MKPIYFPFTHVSSEICQALAACFVQTIVYRPLANKTPEDMAGWTQDGRLDIRVPVSDSGETLQAVARDFRGWANLHQRGAGIKSIFTFLQERGVPLFEPSSPSQIVADMKAHALERSSLKAADPIFLARLFLYLAQEFDRQCREVARALSWSQRKTQDLLQTLTMEADSLGGNLENITPYRAEDASQYMMPERLEAWARLFFRDTVASALFVTHSQAVLETIGEKVAVLEEIFRCDAVPLVSEKIPDRLKWQQKLITGLVQRAENKPTSSMEMLPAGSDFPSAAATLTLRIFLLADQTPYDFFALFTNGKPEDAPGFERFGRFKNTLIGLIEV
jgi:hypothetical protein